MTADDLDRCRRWRLTASTWNRKATALLMKFGDHPNEDVRAVLGWEAGRLVTVMLDEAESLVRLLNDEEYTEEVDRALSQLVTTMSAQRGRGRRRRLAAKLGDTAGRTPEEAEAFTAKARELLSR